MQITDDTVKATRLRPRIRGGAAISSREYLEMLAEREKLKQEFVSDEELKMVKTRAKANLIRGLASNGGIANALAQNHALFGNWRELFYSVEKIDKVTKEDIQRVAKRTFLPTNRTTGMIVSEGGANTPSKPTQPPQKEKVE